MPRLKRLSGSEIVDILSEFGFEIHSQAIFRQATKYISEDELYPFFYQ